MPQEGTEGNLKGRIEAILFVSGEAVAVKELARALAIDEKELKKTLKTALPKYMLPDVLLKRDSLPRTGSGKLDRIALKQEAEREHLIP